MKKYVKLLVGCLLALSLGIFTACENLPFGNKTSDNVSVESSSSEEAISSSEESSSEESSVDESSSEETSEDTSSSSTSIDFPWWPWGSDETSDSSSDIDSVVQSDSSESSVDSSVDSSVEDPPTFEPKKPSYIFSLDRLGRAYSYSPEGYGVEATLTETVESGNNCIKGTFNNVGADTYPGEDGGDWVWTFLAIDLPTINDGCNGDLRNCALEFKLKTVNCSPVSSIILFDENGNRSEEVAFQNNGQVSNAMFDVDSYISNGWVDFVINLPLIYDEDTLDNVSKIALVFSNAYGNNAVDSIFYIDDYSFCDPTRAWTNPTVYNHAGYYDKDEALSVKFAGNSFIEFSASAYWLNEIALANGANLSATYNWTPNGRINDQYSKAFNSVDGYMTNGDKPDVLFIQDFYDLNDALLLGTFLEQTLFVSPFTEVMVYTADNETVDGITAANHYGLDLVNWRAAIHTLKNEHGFTTANLNYPDGATHANELNGVFGAAMAYMQLYGEIPDADALFETILNTQGREGDEVQSFLPGDTLEEKKTYLSIGLRVCAQLCGLDPDGICLHEYTYATDIEAGCETEGLEIGTCIYCDAEVTRSIDPIGHSYTYATAVEPACETEGVELGTCQNCGGETTRPIPALTHVYKNGTCMGCGTALNADPNDLAISPYISTSIIADWNIHSDLTVQSETVSTDSTYALRGAFNVANADSWYDSPEDGGTWVWTVITLDLVQLYGETTDLSKATLTFDMKVVNGDVTSSIILLKSDGTKSAQLPFNQSAETPFASPHAGYTKTILSDGWVRITADLRTLYGADASAVNTICIIVSNAFSDYANDTVYYLDNMELYIPPVFPEAPIPFTMYDSLRLTLNQGEEAWFTFTNLDYTSAIYNICVLAHENLGSITVEAYNPVTGAKMDVVSEDYHCMLTAPLDLNESVLIRVIANTPSTQFVIWVTSCYT